MTAPNGRFIMCIPIADGLVTVEPMTGSDYLPGTIVVKKDIVAFDYMLSYRGLKMARSAAFAFDAAKGHLFVNVQNGMRGVSSSPAAGATHVFDGATWATGTSGSNLFLANVTGTSASVSASGGSVIGAGSVPLTAGAITYVTLVAK